MLNNILNLEGVTTVSKNAQQSIKGGTIHYGDFGTCQRFCAGSCNISGRCFQFEK